MPDLRLERDPDDRHRYVLQDVGAVRLEGLLRTTAAVEAGTGRWRIAPRGFWRRTEVTDAAGTNVGAFTGRLLRGGGTISWHDREYTLRRASLWRERYALADGDHDLAVFDAKSWGRTPVTITIDDPAAIDPGLLLFAAFLARKLAADSGGDGTAGIVAATG